MTTTTTTLHRSIRRGFWENAADDLASDEAEEWARVKYNSDLPLHMACQHRAPPYLIESLLSVYPAAASTPGRGGCLPLHHAMKLSLPFEIIYMLIRSNPRGLDVRDDSDTKPRDYYRATSDADKKVLRLLETPTVCLVRAFDRDVVMEDVLSRIATLEKEKNHLENLLERVLRPRIGELREKIDQLEPLGIAALGQMEHYKIMQRKLQQVEEMVCVKSMICMEKVGTTESAIKEAVDGNKLGLERRAESIRQLQYSERVSQEMKDFQAEMEDVKRRFKLLKALSSNSSGKTLVNA